MTQDFTPGGQTTVDVAELDIQTLNGLNAWGMVRMNRGQAMEMPS